MRQSLEKFSSRRRKILAYVHLNAGASYEKIAQECGTKSHVARAEVKDLLSRGILTPTIVFNHALAGFLKTNVYLSSVPLRAPERKRLINYFLTHARVSWACELLGQFNFGLSIMAHDVLDFDRTLNQLLREFPGVFPCREVIFISEWFYFGKKYLVTPHRIPNYIHTEYQKSIVQLDKIDRGILRLLSIDPFTPQLKISNELKVPLSTINHHLKSLHQRKVLGGSLYWIKYSLIKLSAYRLLISFGGVSKQLRTRIIEFAEAHPNIVSLIFSLGAWDVEFGVDLEDAHSIHDLISRLKDLSRGEVFNVITLQRFDDLRWNTIPPGMFDV